MNIPKTVKTCPRSARRCGAGARALLLVTERPQESAVAAIDQFDLPAPDGLICDAGTSIYLRDACGQFQEVDDYARHLSRMTLAQPIDRLGQSLQGIGGLRLQPPARQGPFKLSFHSSPENAAAAIREIQQRLERIEAPYREICSVDPVSGEHLVDILPLGVSKAYALDWWASYLGRGHGEIVFAGDAGNDWHALTAGYRAILVGNAPRGLAQRVYDAHRERRWDARRLCLAAQPATSGVLEGCRWFGLAPAADPPRPELLGATPIASDRTSFCVWAPNCQSVEVVARAPGRADDNSGSERRHPLQRRADGCFQGVVEGVGPGDFYQYQLNHQQRRPDPASRRQPHGVHGDSEVVHAGAFPWTDAEWRGVAKRDLVIYELHVGAFTGAGAFRSAIERLDELVDLGVTAIELMPVAECPGRWNWGYDGVGLFAVRHTYGAPGDLKALVDACHRRGLAVLLDVVYNHLGPEGNYLAEFGPFFSARHHTPWGPAPDFDGPSASFVRRFTIENALRWIDEYHLDGLRLDAIHYMFDDSTPHILKDLRSAVAEQERRLGRKIHLIAESNIYDHGLLQPNGGETPYDAIWSDCLMHSVYSLGAPDVRLTPRDYNGAPDIAEALAYGYLYTSPGLERAGPSLRQARHGGSREYFESLIVALQTHDAVGNHPHGRRLEQLTSVEFQRAAATLFLLHPGIPMIFMGEEWATPAPFPFFADFGDPQLRKVVDRGRRREYPQHQWKGAVLPSNPAAFFSAKCEPRRRGDQRTFLWYRSLLALRREGRGAGWLDARRLQSVSHDAESGLFQLTYSAAGQTIEIMVRLQAANHDGVLPLHRPLEGQILLDSMSASAGEATLLLQPNHAVVIRRGR